MKERLLLIEYLKNYQETFVMGYDSKTHLQMLINDLQAEEDDDSQ